MTALPTPARTIQALLRGYFPRLLQVRGWVCALIVVLPVALSFGLATILRLQQMNFGSAETIRASNC